MVYVGRGRQNALSARTAEVNHNHHFVTETGKEGDAGGLNSIKWMVDRVVWGLVAVATVYSGALIVSARSTGSDTCFTRSRTTKPNTSGESYRYNY